MKLKPQLTFITFLALALPVSALLAQGGGEFVPLAPIPGVTDQGDFSGYVNGIFRFSLIIASMLAVLYIAFGGLEYMTSESSDRKSRAKARILGAVGGLVLILASYIILNTINPDILNLKLF